MSLAQATAEQRSATQLDAHHRPPTTAPFPSPQIPRPKLFSVSALNSMYSQPDIDDYVFDSSSNLVSNGAGSLGLRHNVRQTHPDICSDFHGHAPHQMQPIQSNMQYEPQLSAGQSFDVFPSHDYGQDYRGLPSTQSYSDPVYSQPFGDALPSFTNSDTYDMGAVRPQSFGKSYQPTSFSTEIHDASFPHMNSYQSAFATEVDPSCASQSYQSDALPEYSERISSRFNSTPGPYLEPSAQSSHISSDRDMIPSNGAYANVNDIGVSSYDSTMSYDGSYSIASSTPSDMSGHLPLVDEPMAHMNSQSQPENTSTATDLHAFIKPFVDQYVRSPNRLAYGERTVIVLSSRVAQKSYGTEKRFLCPPPTAILIGNSWWSDVRQGKVTKYLPPKVVVSISGEPEPPEGTVDWCRASGKPFDVDQPPTGTTYIGRCVGKQLYISDFDEKKKKVEALVKVSAPGFEGAQERVIGVFSSRPIKVISKPSKKRQTAKNLELGINHGCTVSLFHRLRSQTVSTKYLCVSGSTSAFKGSDGAPLMGLDPKTRSGAPSFIARTSSWDPFLIYIVDVTKPVSGTEAPPSPVQPDYPSPPPNAIPFPTNGSQIPIYYNQTIVLQCLNSGVVSPVLIIRKVDHQTTAVGGGQQDTSKSVIDSFCALGEVCGDPVSQLHKIALEVYDPNKAPHEPGAPGPSGAFLSCMGEKVNTFRPTEPRQWVTTMKTESVSPPLPDSPTQATGTLSSNGSVDSHLSVDSAPASPTASTDTSNDGGRVRKKRTGSNASCSPIPSSAVKARRRNSAGSLRGIEPEHPNTPSGASWQVDIGETSVWTVVGTDQIRYNFYIPPVLFDQQHSATPGSYPIPSKPVTPFPGVVKYLPPDRAAEVPKHHMMKINPHVSKLLTIYGENFSRTEPVNVYFGTEPSPFTEFRCNEVMGCLPPEAPINKRRPIFLVRYDGVIYPSDIMYP